MIFLDKNKKSNQKLDDFFVISASSYTFRALLRVDFAFPTLVSNRAYLYIWLPCRTGM